MMSPDAPTTCLSEKAERVAITIIQSSNDGERYVANVGRLAASLADVDDRRSQQLAVGSVT